LRAAPFTHSGVFKLRNLYMPFNSQIETRCLTDVLRHVPTVSSEMSVQRFLDILSLTQFSMLPVVDEDMLVGYAHLSDAQALLASEAGFERNSALSKSVGSLMRAASDFLDPSEPLRSVELRFSRMPAELLAVADPDSRYWGVVSARDLFGSRRLPLKMPTIGGMATPFGVYLSDGVHQAGANNWALISSGAVLGALAVLASFTTHAMLTAMGKVAHVDLSYLTDDFTPPAGDTRQGLMSLLAHICSTLLFLLMVRNTRIAGFHAAEHQTVHAIEHGEELLPEIVARMPRPHPRCGTNLMAAGILFWNLSAFIRTMPGFDTDSATLAAILITMVYWRRFGRMLQSVFTTKPATEKELRSGIAAAEQLIHDYRMQGPRHRTAMRRLWCSGMVQSLIGLAPTLILLSMLLDWWQK
jgi:CBS domain-containing protein